jgi:uncharacterized membrane protein
MIGWQSIPNSTINNAGKVVFHDALNGQGTELEVVISYHPPAGEIGAGIAKLLNPVFEKIIRQDIMNFKEYIETKHNPRNTDGSNPNILRTEQESVNQGEANKANTGQFSNP